MIKLMGGENPILILQKWWGVVLSEEGNITVRLLLFQQLRELIGEKKITMSLPSKSMQNLIDQFVKSYPEASEEILDEDGRFSPLYMVVLNGRLMKRSQWDDIRLREGDEVAFMTFMSGG